MDTRIEGEWRGVQLAQGITEGVLEMMPREMPS